MNWIEIKEEDWIALECTNASKSIYVVRFSPATVNSSDNNEEEIIKRVVPIRYEHHPELLEVKNDAINLQKEYDKSVEVNSFIYANNKYWFTKEERLALVNSFNVLRESGETVGTLWLGTLKLIIDLDTILEFLNNLELYAINCNNITKEHINVINACETIDDIAEFDITAGYPIKLELTIV